MDEPNKKALRETKFAELIGYHHTVGRAIRNEYKLWDPLNPYTNASDVEGPLHPDQVSQSIIEGLWRKLQ